MNYGSAAKTSHLTCGEDTPGKINTCDVINKGFANRQDLSKESTILEMIGHLYTAIFNQGKFLMNGVEMR